MNKNYFQKLEAALKKAEIVTPSLIIDLDILKRNLNYLKTHIPETCDFRLVAKSLPSPELITYCCNIMRTQRLMTFSLSMLKAISSQNAGYEQMLGKPMPAQAAARYLEEFPSVNDRSNDILWLIDTKKRLQEYLNLAASKKIVMQIVLEIDVGLRRGGFRGGAEFEEALVLIRDSKNLELAGLMGYDPHVPKMPKIFGWQKTEKQAVKDRYKRAVGQVSEILGGDVAEGIIRNGAGSPTIYNYSDAGIVNELAAGSALVKPSDFDLPGLRNYKPAAFIATPALKVIDKPLAPGPEKLSGIFRTLGILPPKSIFLYGGKWMAAPVYPKGLEYYTLMGRSSNQEALKGPADLELKPDDFVFLRPTQSEFVLLQFGKILVYENEEIKESWSVYPVHG